MNHDANRLFLNVDQVAARLSVSPDSIWRWKRNGTFPKAIKFGGRTTRWRLSDIEAWEASCRTSLMTNVDLSESVFASG